MLHEWHNGLLEYYDEDGQRHFRDVQHHSVLQKVNGRLAHVPYVVELEAANNRSIQAGMLVMARQTLREFISTAKAGQSE